MKWTQSHKQVNKDGLSLTKIFHGDSKLRQLLENGVLPPVASISSMNFFPAAIYMGKLFLYLSFA